MDKRLPGLKRQISQAARTRAGRRKFDEELRRAVVDYAAGRIAAGESQRRVAKRLGLLPDTLGGWMASSERVTPKRAGRMRSAARVVPVQIADPAIKPSSSIAIVTPGGVRIEGLSLSEAVRAASELG